MQVSRFAIGQFINIQSVAAGAGTVSLEIGTMPGGGPAVYHFRRVPCTDLNTVRLTMNRGEVQQIDGLNCESVQVLEADLVPDPRAPNLRTIDTSNDAAQTVRALPNPMTFDRSPVLFPGHHPSITLSVPDAENTYDVRDKTVRFDRTGTGPGGSLVATVTITNPACEVLDLPATVNIARGDTYEFELRGDCGGVRLAGGGGAASLPLPLRNPLPAAITVPSDVTLTPDSFEPTTVVTHMTISVDPAAPLGDSTIEFLGLPGVLHTIHVALRPCSLEAGGTTYRDGDTIRFSDEFSATLTEGCLNPGYSFAGGAVTPIAIGDTSPDVAPGDRISFTRNEEFTFTIDKRDAVVDGDSAKLHVTNPEGEPFEFNFIYDPTALLGSLRGAPCELTADDASVFSVGDEHPFGQNVQITMSDTCQSVRVRVPGNAGSRAGWLLVIRPANLSKMLGLNTVINPTMVTKSISYRCSRPVSTPVYASRSKTPLSRKSCRGRSRCGSWYALVISSARQPLLRSETTRFGSRPSAHMDSRSVQLPETIAHQRSEVFIVLPSQVVEGRTALV
jgi:hypothetical protein